MPTHSISGRDGFSGSVSGRISGCVSGNISGSSPGNAGSCGAISGFISGFVSGVGISAGSFVFLFLLMNACLYRLEDLPMRPGRMSIMQFLHANKNVTNCRCHRLIV